MKIFCPGPKKNSLIIVRLKCFDTYRALNAIMVEIRSKVYVYTKQIIYTSIREKHAQHIYSSGYETRKVIKVLFLILQISKFIKQNYNDLYIVKLYRLIIYRYISLTRLRIQIFILSINFIRINIKKYIVYIISKIGLIIF